MSGEDGNSHTRLEIGGILERARKEQGLSLQQIEQATKIRAKYLRDLENENFDVLPAVYVLGSLKTYAGYLGLDGEALAGELKHRQALMHERQNEAREEPQAVEARGFFASMGRLFGLGSPEAAEDEAVPDPGHSPRLYLSLGVVLIFAFAVALASTLRVDEKPAVSQVREPKTSQAPSGVALLDTMRSDKLSAEHKRTHGQHEERIESSTKDFGKDETNRAERSGQDGDTSQMAQASPATASASASTSASASASTGSASTTATPDNASPEPAATREPESDGGDMAGSAPAGSPSVGTNHAPGSQGIASPQKRAVPMDATLLGDKIRSKVRNVVDSHR